MNGSRRSPGGKRVGQNTNKDDKATNNSEDAVAHHVKPIGAVEEITSPCSHPILCAHDEHLGEDEKDEQEGGIEQRTCRSKIGHVHGPGHSRLSLKSTLLVLGLGAAAIKAREYIPTQAVGRASTVACRGATLRLLLLLLVLAKCTTTGQRLLFFRFFLIRFDLNSNVSAG